jgi:hypothetical protein
MLLNWSQTDATEKLGIPLPTLNQKIKRLNIEVKRKGSSGASPAASQEFPLSESVFRDGPIDSQPA